MTEFCVVVPNVCESSVWLLLFVALLAPRILRWLLRFWKTCGFLYHDYVCLGRDTVLSGRWIQLLHRQLPHLEHSVTSQKKINAKHEVAWVMMLCHWASNSHDLKGGSALRTLGTARPTTQHCHIAEELNVLIILVSVIAFLAVLLKHSPPLSFCVKFIIFSAKMFHRVVTQHWFKLCFDCGFVWKVCCFLDEFLLNYIHIFFILSDKLLKRRRARLSS
jgi:hypothetical protein